MYGGYVCARVSKILRNNDELSRDEVLHIGQTFGPYVSHSGRPAAYLP